MPKVKEACGLFGVYGHKQAVELTYIGLFSLQHRGQESAGIASVSDGKMACVKGMGRVSEVFKGRHLEDLESQSAIGHVRYSTTGESLDTNAQPMLVRYRKGHVAVAHNGNLVNRNRLRDELEEAGSIFASTTDTEVVLHLLARCNSLSFHEALKKTLEPLQGAFSLLMYWPDRLVGIRDPWGFRPLWVGQLEGAYVFASETAPLEIVGAEPLFEVEPGTYVMASDEGLQTFRYKDSERRAHCMFEHIYFARPDSRLFGDLVQDVRFAAGQRLAREHPVEADIVCPIPDSGNQAAIGYSQESGIPLNFAYVRNHYVGRTFIKPSAKDRLSSVDLKLNIVRSAVEGKRVILVDDSIVRGNTAFKRVKRLREAGAKEVHFRVSCPPTRFPCYYGIDFRSRGELIASSKTVEQIRQHLGLDSLGYLSLDGLYECVSNPPADYCTACWTGAYPVTEGLDDDFETGEPELHEV